VSFRIVAVVVWHQVKQNNVEKGKKIRSNNNVPLLIFYLRHVTRVNQADLKALNIDINNADFHIFFGSVRKYCSRVFTAKVTCC
jgi:hypothetical protein